MQMKGKSTQIKQEQIHDRIQGPNDTTLQQSKIQGLEEELQLVTEKLNEADIRAKLYQEVNSPFNRLYLRPCLDC